MSTQKEIKKQVMLLLSGLKVSEAEKMLKEVIRDIGIISKVPSL